MFFLTQLSLSTFVCTDVDFVCISMGMRRRYSVQWTEVVEEQAMNEDVPSSYFAQENALSGVVEKLGIVPGDGP
jgi:hypothetical protein